MKPEKASRLQELDRFIFMELVPQLESMESPLLTKDELQRVTEYKQLRGQFRISLSQKVASNAEAKVKDITQAAFKQIEKWHEARRAVPANTSDEKHSLDEIDLEDQIETPIENVVAALNVLDRGEPGLGKGKKSAGKGQGLTGVGPATAAIILSLADKSCVYFDDDAYIAALDDGEEEKKRKVKVAYTLDGYVKMLTQIRRIAQKIGWDARKVGRALWAVCVGRKLGLSFNFSPENGEDDSTNDSRKKRKVEQAE
ncbi:hypothetical protein HDU96_007469 [Phlyctochytrium bullatum]|nr:hypothetical protein HDU96_007469 [Phlyctochytrium bullatum]